MIPYRTLLGRIAGLTLLLTTVLWVGCRDNDHVGNGCGNGTCDPDEDPTTCPWDCGCGNGILNPEFGEQCDGSEFGNLTCSDFDCFGGTLTCGQDCLIQSTNCSGCPPFCGDGHRNQGEECDCGADRWDLPGGCTDVNGGPNANCSTDCDCQNTCGNGIPEVCEVCDCGVDPQNLPQYCTQVNGPTGNCSADCQRWCQECLNNWCDPAELDYCCPDRYGNTVICDDWIYTQPRCLLECATTDDCYYNMVCMYDRTCAPAYCGQDSTFVPGSNVNEPCQVPGGGQGFCWPVRLAWYNYGICIESGTVPPGETCDATPSGDLETTEQPRDMTWNRCNMGICSTTSNTCIAICDPVDVYENETNSVYCPAGTNCFGHSFIYDEGGFDDGCRYADQGTCIEQSTDPQVGEYTCDITTGELIADRSQVCADVQADLMCIPTSFQEGPGYGTRIGVCHSLVSTVASYWQPCTPGTDICPEGSECFNEDIFGAGTGQNRCIPWCDTTNPVPCYQQHAEVPTDNRCTSASLMFTGEWCTEPAAFHSKLGLCACPVAGCGTGWCGNDVIDGSETCDGSDLGSMNCTNQGCQAGCTLSCNSTCDGTSVANC